MISARAILTTIVLGATASASFAQWKAADGPLMTRWAAEVKPERVHAEYPRPQLVREKWLSLNGLWEFAPAKSGDQPPVGKKLDRSILVPFPVESSLSGVMELHDRLWYRRTFEVPAAWKGQRVRLNFGAVDWETNVVVNGKPVGNHRGGYDAFSFDITDALKPDGPQEVIVSVYDPTDASTQPRGKQVRKPEGIWYTPTTGIWQTVWLEPVAETYIESASATTDLKSGAVTLRLKAANAKPGDTATLTVREGSKSLVSTTIDLPGDFSFTLPEPKLWSPEHPHLYECTVQLGRKGATIDSVESYFALRTVSLGTDEKGFTRLMLNGKPYFQLGLLDQGFWPDGLYTAPTDEAMKYDLEVTKRLGYNMVRKHVKVEPARWYYWTDKLGLVVWQDMPSGDRYIGPRDPDITRTPESGAQYEVELRAIMGQLMGNPSVIMWVPFNEGWGQFDTARITKLVKDLDPSRLVNGTSGWADRGVSDVYDFHVYPGPGAPPPEKNRAGVLGEFGGLGLAIPKHTWSKASWGYQGMADQRELTDRYVELIRGVHELISLKGLSAAVYTQTTDVETECNGLLTYDRAIMKLDEGAVRAAHSGKYPRVTALEPTAQEGGQKWHWTTSRPRDGWERPGFDESSWKHAQGGFGTAGTPGATIGTVWNTPDIWLRRVFDMPKTDPRFLRLSVHHDEDVEIYINGVLGATGKGYTTAYRTLAIAPEAVAALKPSGNVLAVHCKQTGGGQFIDVAFVEVKPAE